MKKIIVLAFLILGIIIAFNAFKASNEAAEVVVEDVDVDRSIVVARQTEAKLMLRELFTQQREYFAKNSHFAKNVEDLVRFGQASLKKGDYYELEMLEAEGLQFRARATGNIDNDPAYDIWEIDDSGQFNHVYDDVSN